MVADERYMADDFDGEDRAIVKVRDGAVVLPASARRLKGEALELYLDLSRVGMQLHALERALEESLVPAARDLDLSWSLIGAALGITGEGARRRYAS